MVLLLLQPKEPSSIPQREKLRGHRSWSCSDCLCRSIISTHYSSEKFIWDVKVMGWLYLRFAKAGDLLHTGTSSPTHTRVDAWRKLTSLLECKAMQCNTWQQICITALNLWWGDLMPLCKRAVPAPDPQTESRGDIQVHAAEHTALFFASHTWK